MSQKRPPVPARVDSLDRRAVERVLARAAELQATRGGGSDSAELISETQLVEIAYEAGLDTSYVRQALAEERTHLPEMSEQGRLARTFGPARLATGRTVDGRAADVLSTLDRWMQKEECMTLQRRFPERIAWEPRTDLMGTLRRDFGIGGKYELAKSDSVAATAVDLGEGKALVAIEADIGKRRRASLGWGAVFAAAGLTATVVLSTLGFFLPIALIPFAAGAAIGWMTGRSHRGRASKVQLALEQVLDKLEYTEPKKPGVIASAIDAATRPLLR